MSKRVFNDYHPEIFGLDWAPGNLILVASRSWGGKNQYVLGNCIVAGTKEEIPVIDFLITHGPAYSYPDRDLGCKQLFLSVASARSKYHIFGHVHEEGLQRKAMLGGTTFLNVSYFKELRKNQEHT